MPLVGDEEFTAEIKFHTFIKLFDAGHGWGADRHCNDQTTLRTS
jgi:hypothetical protein